MAKTAPFYHHVLVFSVITGDIGLKRYREIFTFKTFFKVLNSKLPANYLVSPVDLPIAFQPWHADAEEFQAGVQIILTMIK